MDQDWLKPYIEHPQEHFRKAQVSFLSKLQGQERKSQYFLFCIGNACYRYYQQANQAEITVDDFEFWLSGLPIDKANKFREEGLKEHRDHLALHRSINERKDLGLDEYLKNILKPDDFEAYIKISSSDGL